MTHEHARVIGAQPPAVAQHHSLQRAVVATMAVMHDRAGLINDRPAGEQQRAQRGRVLAGQRRRASTRARNRSGRSRSTRRAGRPCWRRRRRAAADTAGSARVAVAGENTARVKPRPRRTPLYCSNQAWDLGLELGGSDDSGDRASLRNLNERARDLSGPPGVADLVVVGPRDDLAVGGVDRPVARPRETWTRLGDVVDLARPRELGDQPRVRSSDGALSTTSMRRRGILLRREAVERAHQVVRPIAGADRPP